MISLSTQEVGDLVTTILYVSPDDPEFDTIVKALTKCLNEVLELKTIENDNASIRRC